MRKLLVIAILMCLNSMSFASTTYFSDGTYATTNGNSTYYSDGSYSTQSGNTTYFSDGSYATTSRY